MAEGIKISEFELVTTLQDACCFPVVSEGENKRITTKSLFNLFENKIDMNNHIATIKNLLFPVGSFYIYPTTPRFLFGGTWREIGRLITNPSDKYGTHTSVGYSETVENQYFGTALYVWQRTN